MTFIAVIFAILSGYFLFSLPKRKAPLPLLVGTSYMTLGQELLIGPFHFTLIRILIAMGVLRVMMRGEKISGGWTKLDRMMILWALWAIASSVFHEDVSSTLIGRLGLTYDCLGLYFLLRIFIEDLESILSLCKIIIIVLTPVALEMLGEVLTGRNSFSIFGGVSVFAQVRDGAVRAQGPFAHAILAGTVGAICFPMAFLFWKRNRKVALLGISATGLIILCSRSSGPIMTLVFVLCGLSLWKYREHMRFIRWMAVSAIIALDIVMKAPVYYLLARIDLTGSSTGYHRAALIEAAITHLNEWWLAGTDYTRHWMPYGVLWSEKHTDITNHYLKMGVLGGLPLMLLFIWTLVYGFSLVGQQLRFGRDINNQFLSWVLGTILFGHVATMMSVSYFDQSVFFLYLTLAAIASASATLAARERLGVSSAPVQTQTLVEAFSANRNNLCHNC